MEKFVLIKPSAEYLDELASYKAETLSAEDHMHGDSGLDEADDIAAWIESCKKTETDPPSGFVAAEQFMFLREGETRIIGLANFRHSLGEEGSYLSRHGGHFGGSVRPSERNKGYAKAMLLMCLDKARERGLEKVLLVCAPDNETSRKTIIACSGQYESTVRTGDEVDDRYWIHLK